MISNYSEKPNRVTQAGTRLGLLLQTQDYGRIEQIRVVYRNDGAIGNEPSHEQTEKGL